MLIISDDAANTSVCFGEMASPEKRRLLHNSRRETIVNDAAVSRTVKAESTEEALLCKDMHAISMVDCLAQAICTPSSPEAAVPLIDFNTPSPSNITSQLTASDSPTQSAVIPSLLDLPWSPMAATACPAGSSTQLDEELQQNSVPNIVDSPAPKAMPIPFEVQTRLQEPVLSQTSSQSVVARPKSRLPVPVASTSRLPRVTQAPRLHEQRVNVNELASISTVTPAASIARGKVKVHSPGAIERAAMKLFGPGTVATSPSEHVCIEPPALTKGRRTPARAVQRATRAMLPSGLQARQAGAPESEAPGPTSTIESGQEVGGKVLRGKKTKKKPSLTPAQLLAITKRHTEQNKAHYNAFETFTVYKDINRPPSPSERLRRSSDPALNAATRGSRLLKHQSSLDPQATVRSPTKSHRLAPGDEESYSTPLQPLKIKLNAERSASGTTKLSIKKPAGRVRWDKGLVSDEPAPDLLTPRTVRVRERELLKKPSLAKSFTGRAWQSGQPGSAVALCGSNVGTDREGGVRR
ncbi:uncharacterized protein L969DRAFT_45972 [Mixia osmundae IAM 14324]|uniref:Uncharacterized protein n=1 Tax=Mixia osmundae (strain CBS 9802 / IAM 14324 / JCM 22182 / KY 12970) TaxID=764103 RepID=G7DU26_MIXOS|nr:uncharacterized protein L969DRAFT_45972 [Mixia osmundae IAM 14324]KEI40953.1 hypothetical protein L969DRAFT_45972 [Mixia osmundae IAM 14324]GAA94086.1 hypothetical protein E5Q_00733 [Mixia osmundae IAM 14324]